MKPEWKVLTTAPAGSPEWLEKHKGKIGSNDITSIMGVGRKSRLRLFGEMTGKIQREDLSKLPYIRRGSVFEPVVTCLYEEETGNKVMNTPGLVQHPELEYVAVTPDGLVALPKGPLANYEAKTVGAWKRRDWDADVPLRVQVQGHAQMWVLGLDITVYAALCFDAEPDEISDDDEGDAIEDELLLYAERERREDLIQLMGEQVVQFMEKHVKADIPPTPDGDLKAVKEIWSVHTQGAVKPLPAVMEASVLRNFQIAAMRTDLKKEQDSLKAMILAEMGDAEYGETPGGVVVRARVEPKKEHMRPASYPRVLRKVKKVGG